MESAMGRVALITGGASGIGLGMARAFGEAGMKLAIADVNDARRDAAVAELSSAGIDCFGVKLDVSSADSWAAAADAVERHFGPIDVLCNNAGVNQSATSDGGAIQLAEMTEHLFRQVFDVNVLGVFLGIRVVAPRMIERAEGGHIVNTSSMAGLIAPAGLGCYSASKFAVVALSETLRGELLPHGIGVSVLCPGGVQSNLVGSSAERRAAAFGEDSGRAAASTHQANPEMMDPLAVGRRVLAAIAANELYILTHPEYAPLIEERFNAIRSSIGPSAQHGHADPGRLLTSSRNPAYRQVRRTPSGTMSGPGATQ